MAQVDTLSPAVVGLRLVGYTRLRHCEFTDWLLQHCSCRCTKNSNGQVTACVECGCARRHRHSKVWPWPGSDTAWWTSLARRPRPGVFQAGSDCSPMSERPRTSVPVGLLRPDRQCWLSKASANRQLLAVPRYRLNTYSRQAFSVVGSTVWNSLSDFIRDPTISANCFRRLLKT